MPDRKHIQTIDGQPRPTDIFQPHLVGVELFEDMDEVFREARRIAAGEHPDHTPVESKMVKGQRAVAIVTPGRLVMLDPAPPPNSVPDEQVAPMLELVPRDPPLNISVISYTYIEALVTDMTKAIPFRGFLIAWAYAGHNVIVFEGHPSAFESGVRDADVLLIDSGMIPFVQFDWLNAARRVMSPKGKIFIHDRATYTLSQVIEAPSAAPPGASNLEPDYAEALLRLLIRSTQTSVEITAGEIVPDLLDLAKQRSDRDWVTRSIDRDKVNAEKVIDVILHRSGLGWLNPFKRTGVLNIPVPLANGTMGKWKFALKLTKNSAGKKQLRIER